MCFLRRPDARHRWRELDFVNKTIPWNALKNRFWLRYDTNWKNEFQVKNRKNRSKLAFWYKWFSCFCLMSHRTELGWFEVFKTRETQAWKRNALSRGPMNFAYTATLEEIDWTPIRLRRWLRVKQKVAWTSRNTNVVLGGRFVNQRQNVRFPIWKTLFMRTLQTFEKYHYFSIDDR